VLDHHKPRWEQFGYEPRVTQRRICGAETQVWGQMNDYTDYPCDTVLEIARALGVEVPDGRA
jgi:hypothetical protein